MIDPEELVRAASDRNREFRELFSFLKRKKPKNLDEVTHQLHREVFAETDCLECANCCKTLSPFLTDRDIARLATTLKMKPSEFTERYLRVDEENDYVFKESPCPFLMPDNYCSVYSDRPKACREYPHTDRQRFVQILDLTLKNTQSCPAVFDIVMALKKEYRR